MRTDIASGHTAVMAQRHEPPDSLDFFPSPPWSTRALCEHVIGVDHCHGRSVWEPAAGEGHMADVLAEYFGHVRASDVHDYGCHHAIGSFTGSGPDVIAWNNQHHSDPDWIITNPPFTLAAEFAQRAIREARHGVALLVRTAWLEGGERWRTLFSIMPPATVALFAERVPMVKGRWDPDASTATSYAWVVWRKPFMAFDPETRLVWIPPGQRKALEKPDDRKRFAGVRESAA